MKFSFIIFAHRSLVGLCLVMTLMATEGRPETDPFPVYDCIQPNVSFWKKVFTQYSSRQGVIHDKDRLEIIYGVVDLEDRQVPGSARINEKRVEAARNRYGTILKQLAEGQAAATDDERRVAELFGPTAGPSDFRAASRNLRCQIGLKDRFREGLIRSGAYLPQIRGVFRQYGLPEDLAYLPHVESSYDPAAYSKFGAAGIWQFTGSTGRLFMTVGYVVDERREPIVSTHAAARLLQKCFEELGSWPLAITAYNHGLQGMHRAVAMKGGYEAIYKEYESRIFQFASRNFYSEFLAAREVARNYRRYFGDLHFDSPPKHREIVLAGYAAVDDLARRFNVKVADLRELNPALREPVFRGQKYVPKGYRLRLPLKDGQTEALKGGDALEGIYQSEQKPSRFYTVRKGDTAKAIARAHGIKLEDLISANRLDSRATVYLNQNLRLPLSGEKRLELAQAESPGVRTREAEASGRLEDSRSDQTSALEATAKQSAGTPAASAERPTSKPAATIKAKSAAEETAVDRIYALAAPAGHPTASPEPAQLPEEPPDKNQAQSALAATSEEFSVEELGAANIAADMVSPGADLEAPVTLTDSRPVPPINPEVLIGTLAVEKLIRHKGKPVGLIRVEVEETLGHYAEWLEIPTQELRRLNGFRYGRPLQISEQIKIPLGKVSREQFEERRYEYHKELVEDFFASYRIGGIQTYRIQKGDNIWQLSQEKFAVPLWLIKLLNTDVDFGALRPAQQLTIPVVEKNA
jgi:membrane-bound lytic murein transglycosylase D